MLPQDQKRQAFQLIVLSILSDEPLYGYAIIKRVASQSADQIRLTPGALYPLLHHLEAQKLISCSWETVRSDRHADPHETPGRKRKWYRLTPKGRKHLARRIAAHRAHQTMIESFLPPAPEGEPA